MECLLDRVLRSCSLEAQRAEATVAARALNRMAELGVPWVQRVTGGRRWASPGPRCLMH